MTDLLLPTNAQQAITLLRSPQTRIYLGARYGLTPHTRISPEKADLFLDVPAGKKHHEPFCDLATEVELAFGQEALKGIFIDKYGDIEMVTTDAKKELELLRPLAHGKFFVTGSYSSDIVNNFPRLSTAFDEQGRKNIRLDAMGQNASLVLLHGWRSNPATALVTREEIDSFDSKRPEISSLTKGLLHEKPWLVVGYKEGEDATFMRLCLEVCRGLGLKQRPIYVVDPEDTERLHRQWPRDALRHVRMEILDFLRAAMPKGEPSPSTDGPDTPSSDGSGDPTFEPDGRRPPPGPAQASGTSGGDKRDSCLGPPTEPGPNNPRTLRIISIDGRAFRTTAPGNMRISALASRFIRHETGSEDPRGRRAVVDLVAEGGQRIRLNGSATLDEANINDDAEVCIYSDTVAGGMDPRRHEAYLTDVQHQLEAMAQQDDRVSVKSNLPQASDRYQITLRCGGWGPSEESALKPIRTEEQKVFIEYPAEAPNAPPKVRWDSAIYHPNVHPKNGYVCLGALQENFTPLFGPQELVRMLIELSEYRNFELDGVLNREAAIWAQLNPEIIVEHGGWAYQPTLQERPGDEIDIQLSFEPQPTGVGLRRRRKS